MLRDSSAWIGVKRDNGTTRVVTTNNLTMDQQQDEREVTMHASKVPLFPLEFVIVSPRQRIEPQQQ
jgi:hypothetical protein